MKYTDQIYGEIDIVDDVILDLINSKELQRLKGIDQSGYFEPYYPNTTYSRFEHSLGVYILLNIFNAPIEEQISGLIHDVSHSAFSHCIDYVLESGSQKEQNHQDNVFADFVKRTGIPQILQKHNLDLKYILDDNNFPLKERSIPELCADRIDYSLRTAVISGEIKSANHFIQNIIIQDNNWVFKDFAIAKEYAQLFWKINNRYYAGIESAVMFQTVGDYLRYALQKKYITKEDLYTTDKQVLNKISKHKDPQLNKFFNKMNNKVRFENNPNNYDSHIFCKSRIVDPFCIDNNQIKRFSDIDTNWKELLIKELEPKEYFLKFGE